MMASICMDKAQHFEACDLCQQPVSFFCRRCGVNLCDPCVTIHLRVKSKYGHEIVNFTSKDDDTCVCGSHPKNNCSAFCKTCDAPICIICVAIKHKTHEISELSDKIEEILKIIVKENDRLQSSKHDLERILNHTTNMLFSIPSIYQQRKDKVTARGEEWHKYIEKTVKKLHHELDDMQKEHENILRKQKKKFKEMIGKVDEMNRKTIKFRKSKNITAMKTFVPVIQTQKIVSEVSKYSFPKFYECKVDESIEYKLKEKELLGRRILEVPTVTSVIDSGFPAGKENGHRLYDLVVTEDNKVWMGGRSGELKLFDLQGHFHHSVNITPPGLFFCMYKNKVMFTDRIDNTVNVAFGNGSVVVMFTTGDWTPYGITSTASGDLLVCLRKGDQSKVVRYSSTGTVLQEIQYNSQCQPLYEKAVYITENLNGDIIVTDWEKYAVIAVDKLGIFRYSYAENENKFDVLSFAVSAFDRIGLFPEKDLASVTKIIYFDVNSVATDSVGHVIVTECYGGKIHMLDKDGRFLKYIIPDAGLKCPHGVCILGHGEMMVGERMTGIVKRVKYLKEYE
ncbi:uncharacterized protein LOC128176314 [Crassostrea angulata]|uniref:uncharacterized protein LOC128176314 n=1 Tax=Magallana angulata TaxID=2784310 RepID=UPI0022B0FF15|nr:uncharacterized protein LOC128176314 [Crassostrea angulata]